VVSEDTKLSSFWRRAGRKEVGYQGEAIERGGDGDEVSKDGRVVVKIRFEEQRLRLEELKEGSRGI